MYKEAYMATESRYEYWQHQQAEERLDEPTPDDWCEHCHIRHWSVENGVCEACEEDVKFKFYIP